MGHEDVLKLTDLKDIFEDGDEGCMEDQGSEQPVDSDQEGPDVSTPAPMEGKKQAEGSDSEEAEPEGEPKSKKRKKQTKDPLAKKRGKKGKNQIVTDPSFFSGL